MMTEPYPLITPQIAPLGQVLFPPHWGDYALLDSGYGHKLELYGRYLIVRPEPQCAWAPRLKLKIWQEADAWFETKDMLRWYRAANLDRSCFSGKPLFSRQSQTGSEGDPLIHEEEKGQWLWQNVNHPAPQDWRLSWEDLQFHARLTPFRHLAFFPEQAANWLWLHHVIQAHTLRTGTKPHILNLFGYTGLASLVCARAGGRVTHVDASKKAISYARENAEFSGLQHAPIRWICEDVRRYVQREAQRGMTYDGIILDPPKHGHGPKNEVWRLFEDLPDLLSLCRKILAPKPGFVLLNAYTARLSGLSLAHILAQSLETHAGAIDWGELALIEQASSKNQFMESERPARAIGLSFFARWLGESWREDFHKIAGGNL